MTHQRRIVYQFSSLAFKAYSAIDFMVCSQQSIRALRFFSYLFLLLNVPTAAAHALQAAGEPLSFSIHGTATDRNRLRSLDSYARRVPTQYESDVQHLLRYLLRPARDDLEKLRLIYSWLISHVVYSHSSHLSKSFFVQGDLKDLLEHGLACDGYGLIFQQLVAQAGIQVKTIEGFARDGLKPPQATKNHLWDAVKVDGHWWLVDPTWAAGSVSGEHFKTDPDDYYFMAPLDAFALSHYDFDDQFGIQRQLGLSWDDFIKLPDDAPNLLYAGFTVRQVLAYFSANNHTVAVRTFDQPRGRFNAHKLPMAYVIHTPGRVAFEVSSSYYDDIAIVQGSSWIHLSKAGSVFSIRLAPRTGELLIMGRPKDGSDYEALLQYTVR